MNHALLIQSALAELISNPLVFVAVTALLGFVAYQIVLGILLLAWPQERIRWQTRTILGIGVVVAAAVAVSVHDLHVHGHLQSGHFMHQCLEAPDCREAFEAGVKEAAR